MCWVYTTLNDMDRKDQEQLIARYLNGELSGEDAAGLLEWINGSTANRKLFMEIKDTWDVSLKNKDRQAEQLLLFYKKQAQKKRGASPAVWVALSSAAVLILALLFGVLKQKTPLLTTQFESFTVPMGSRSSLVLADGTKVNLNSGSNLILDEQFSSQNRMVRLTGEGYFEVKADSRHPFTVKTEKFDVIVTGTKFNISSYADDRNNSAALLEGKITLILDDQQDFVLEPGQKLSIDRLTRNTTLEVADRVSEMAWVNGEFVFKEIPFPDLIRRLERWYDVTLVYPREAFDSMMYSGSFKHQETIWQVLDALKLTTPIDYRKRNFREFELIYRPM